MIIFSYWDDSPEAPPFQAELVALWRRSWMAHGWECRLLTSKDVRRLKQFPPDGEFYVPPWVMNFGLAPEKKGFRLGSCTYRFGRTGWELTPLIDFGADATPELIESCGRSLNAS